MFVLADQPSYVAVGADIHAAVCAFLGNKIDRDVFDVTFSVNEAYRNCTFCLNKMLIYLTKLRFKYLILHFRLKLGPSLTDTRNGINLTEGVWSSRKFDTPKLIVLTL